MCVKTIYDNADDDKVSKHDDAEKRTDALWVTVIPGGAAVTCSSGEADFTVALARVVTVVFLSPHFVTATRYNTNRKYNQLWMKLTL